MTIKTEVRVATGKQYEYTSHWLEGTLESNLQHEKEIRAAYEPSNGLPTKEWNPVVDAALANTLTLNPYIWESMSEFQREFLQTIKRSRNRV